MFPQLNPIARQQLMTDQFRGYYHRASVPDGMFSEMTNITADDYPVMSTRRPRGIIGTIESPLGMIAKDAVAYLAVNQGAVELWYNGKSAC